MARGKLIWRIEAMLISLIIYFFIGLTLIFLGKLIASLFLSKVSLVYFTPSNMVISGVFSVWSSRRIIAKLFE